MFSLIFIGYVLAKHTTFLFLIKLWICITNIWLKILLVYYFLPSWAMPATSWTIPAIRQRSTAKSALVPFVYVNVRRDSNADGPMFTWGHVPINAYTKPPMNEAYKPYCNKNNLDSFFHNYYSTIRVYKHLVLFLWICR